MVVAALVIKNPQTTTSTQREGGTERPKVNMQISRPLRVIKGELACSAEVHSKHTTQPRANMLCAVKRGGDGT